MRYRDLAAAMGWLEQAFGFEKQIAVADSDGESIYGQMTYRGGLIMMGAVRDTHLDKLMRQPDEVGGVETQSCYLVVDDADQHYARAVEAGADIVLELKSDGLGRRGYSCRDPEGHIWSFGTYNPGRGLTMTVAPAALPVAEEPAADAPPRRARGFLMSLAALLVVAGAAGWMLTSGADRLLAARTPDGATHASRADADRAYAELVKVRAEKRLADERLAALTRDLETERARAAAASAKPSTGADADATDAALAQEKSAREAAEKAVASLRQELQREQQARDAAVEAKRVMEEKLAALAAVPEGKPTLPASSEAPGPQSDATPAPSVAGSVAGDANGIETSATNAAPQAEAPSAVVSEPEDKDADRASEDRGKSTETKRERSARAQPRIRRSEPQPTVSKRYPAYVTDLKQVWPYALWSN
jgi:uncharacterized glyoxalase superfamily protein PhnB